MSDANFDQVSLLLHCDGVNSGTEFSDEAKKCLVIPSGNVLTSTAQKKFGASSAYFDGTGDYLSIVAGTLADLQFGTGDFTIEFQIKPDLIRQQALIDFRPASTVGVYPLVYMDATGHIMYLVNEVTRITSSVAVALTGFAHVAVVRYGSTTTLYINGTASGTPWADATNYNAGVYGRPTIGAQGYNVLNDNYNGYLDEVRITKGVARYTSDFTAPVAAFDTGTVAKADDSPEYKAETIMLMHFDGANGSKFAPDSAGIGGMTFPAGSSAALSTAKSKFGASALYPGVGTSPYAYYTTTGAYPAVGAGSFTIECAFYCLTVPNLTQLFDCRNIGNGNYPSVYFDATGHPIYYVNSAIVLTSSVPVLAGRWYHFALTRESGVVKMFLDGVMVASAAGHTADLLNAASRPMLCGSGTSLGASIFLGYVDEFRITKGISRYNTGFVPPTKAFYRTPDTDSLYDNVVMHCHFDGEPGAATFSDRKGHTITQTVGGCSLDAAVSKFGGSALGKTDPAGYNRAVSSDFNLGSGDFTIELWGYCSSQGNDYPVLSFENSDGSGDGLAIFIGAHRGAKIGAGYPLYGSGGAASTWTHVAVSRVGTALLLHLDGVYSLSYNIGATAISQNNALRIGGGADFAATGNMSTACRIDELRITKGVSRYSAVNFSVPTTPFPHNNPKKLSGVVRDAAGNPISRTVRAFRRSDAMLIGTAVSDPVTGVFSVPAIDTSEHFAIVHDDTKNALIYDHIVPVL